MSGIAWSDIIVALGLVLVIEGTLYALFPDAMRRAMALALGNPSSALRMAGLVSILAGTVIVWFIRG